MTMPFALTMTFIDQLTSGRLVNWVASILLHFVWQGAFLAALFWVMLRAVRTTAPRLRYRLACVGMLVMAVAPLLTGFVLRDELRMVPTQSTAALTSPLKVERPLAPDTPATPLSAAAGESQALNLAAVPSSDLARVASTLQWFHAFVNRYASILVGGWVLGVSFCTLRLLSSLRAVKFLRRTGTAILDERLIAAFATLIDRLKMNSRIQLMQSTAVSVPMVLGWIRPIVLCPVAFSSGLSIDQIEAILSHELAHIKRHDYLVNLLQSFAETVLFYHPAVWWISSTIRNEREYCCDAIAVNVIEDPGLYARSLFELAHLVAAPRPLSMSANGGSLKDRIARILNIPTPARSGTGPIVTLAIGLIVVFGLAISQLPKAKASDSKEVKVATDQVEKDEKKSTKSDAVPDPKRLYRVTFVRAKHVLMHDGRIITWKDVDPIIEATITNHQKVQPAFLQTNGSMAMQKEKQAEMDAWWKESYSRFYKAKKLDGVSMGSVSPRASERYDRVKVAADLMSDESEKLTGTIVGVDGKPVKDVEVFLLPAFFQGGVHVQLQNGQLRDPYDEHVVHSDNTGHFVMYRDPNEAFIAATHPDGFFIAELESFEKDESIKLQPWARIHGSVATEDDAKQSVSFTSYPSWRDGKKDLMFNVWETEINEEDQFDQRFLPPGKIIVQRSLKAGSMGLNFNVSQWLLEPGASEEVNVGPIPEEQKKQALDLGKRDKNK